MELKPFVLFQNFSQALAAKAQGVSYVRVFGGPSLLRSDIELRPLLPQGSSDFGAFGQHLIHISVLGEGMREKNNKEVATIIHIGVLGERMRGKEEGARDSKKISARQLRRLGRNEHAR